MAVKQYPETTTVVSKDIMDQIAAKAAAVFPNVSPKVVSINDFLKQDPDFESGVEFKDAIHILSQGDAPDMLYDPSGCNPVAAVATSISASGQKQFTIRLYLPKGDNSGLLMDHAIVLNIRQFPSQANPDNKYWALTPPPAGEDHNMLPPQKTEVLMPDGESFRNRSHDLRKSEALRTVHYVLNAVLGNSAIPNGLIPRANGTATGTNGQTEAVKPPVVGEAVQKFLDRSVKDMDVDDAVGEVATD